MTDGWLMDAAQEALDRIGTVRPKWAEAVRWFVTEDIIDEKYEFPDDGTDDTILEEIETAVLDILCRHYGHEIVDDQCMKPEHRFCVYCNRRESTLAT